MFLLLPVICDISGPPFDTFFRLRSEYFVPVRMCTIVHYVETDFLCFHYPADYDDKFLGLLSEWVFLQPRAIPNILNRRIFIALKLKGRFTTYQIKCNALPSSYNIYLIVVDIEY